MWRRPAALAAEVLLVLAAGRRRLVHRPGRKPAIAFAERDWVVVGDLRNLTGDELLDDSLDQAFRISLEQSRYVNVISDLKMRETLQRMQRKPDTQIDRALGSEIAMRDGARALLLPTVAEIGGRLRVSTEVIDPRTQTTVYAVSADGKGIESALGSIDDVTDQLREKLGEACRTCRRPRCALPNVATPSLDALKAFALARNVVNTTRDAQTALGLYRRALQLDPEFALVYADLASLHAGYGLVDQAKAQWTKALSLPKRLSGQEKQRIELLQEQYGPPAPYFKRMDQYLTLYPDDYSVISRRGTIIWHTQNDFRAMEASYRKVLLKPAYPRQGVATYSMAIALLGQEKIAEAKAAFDKAIELGFTGAGVLHARAFDVSRQHALADQTLARGTAGREGWVGEDGIVTWLDRGEWARAEAIARDMIAQARETDDGEDSIHAPAALASVLTISGQPAARQAIADLMVQADLAKGTPGEVNDNIEIQLFAGLLAAHRGDVQTVNQVLGNIAGQSAIRDFPMLAQQHSILMAEQARLSGKPEVAAARLRPLAQQANALLMVHWSLLNAERDAGNIDAALAQAHWLSGHRGRGFVENTGIGLLGNLNIVATTQASLEAAELASVQRNMAEARKQLAAFLQAWPLQYLPASQKQRVEALQRDIQNP